MRRHYPRESKEKMAQKSESFCSKMRYIDFAKENDITLETLKTWIYDSRQKMKTRAGIVEIKTREPQKNEEEKIPVHITLHTRGSFGKKMVDILSESKGLLQSKSYSGYNNGNRASVGCPTVPSLRSDFRSFIASLFKRGIRKTVFFQQSSE